MNKQTLRTLLPVTAIALVVSFSAVYGGFVSSAAAVAPIAACGTGQYEAVLTGWILDGMTPTGTAHYSAANKRLEVEVKNVNLKDGVVLDVRIGDDKIGKMQPLKENSAKAVITVEDELDEKSRVRIFNDEVPILSANLTCDTTPSPSPTATGSL